MFEPVRYVQSSRLGIVSSPGYPGLISRARIQKLLPYPSWSGLSRFGSISAAAYWQGLDAPLIVELFTVCFFGRTPEIVSPRLVGIATARLPTPAHVTRTCRAFHPNGHCGFGPRPVGGFEVYCLAPTLSQTALPDFTAKHFPFARIRESFLAVMR